MKIDNSHVTQNLTSKFIEQVHKNLSPFIYFMYCDTKKKTWKVDQYPIYLSIYAQGNTHTHTHTHTHIYIYIYIYELTTKMSVTDLCC